MNIDKITLEKTLKEIEEKPTLLNNYHTALRELRSYVEREYYPGREAEVVSLRYNGKGTIVCEDTPPDKIAVRIENGNVWWYDLVWVTPL